MSNAAALLHKAISHHQAGRLREAEDAYLAHLRQPQISPEAWRLLGALYLAQKQWDRAALYLEKAAQALPPNAETLTNLGIALRATERTGSALESFKKALDIQPGYRNALYNLGRLFLDRGQGDEAAGVLERLVAHDPGNAEAHFLCASAYRLAQQLPAAKKHYAQTLQLNPEHVEAYVHLGYVEIHAGDVAAGQRWMALARAKLEDRLRQSPEDAALRNNLAIVLMYASEYEAAAVHLREALRVRPDYVEAAVNLGTVLRDLGQIDEAIEWSQKALRLRPGMFAPTINLATFLQNKMRHEEALLQLDVAQQIDPSSVDVKWNKSLSLLALGRFDEAWPLYECGVGVANMRGGDAALQQEWARAWRRGDIAGKRLLLYCEQGFGDSLHFVRYAALCKARGAQVSVLAPPELSALFSRCPFIDACFEEARPEDFDLSALLMSLPYLLGGGAIPAQVPYLFTGDAARAKAATLIPDSGGFKVGLVWAGSPRPDQPSAHLTDRRRSMDLGRMLPLFDVPGAQFFSLQKGVKSEQIAALGVADRLVDPMGDVRNFEETAALIERLDLVISVDTSVAHLAGGLGKPIWILSRFDACWRWLQNRPDSPWYPTARIFGQKTPGDWDGVMAEVKAALAKIGAGEVKSGPLKPD